VCRIGLCGLTAARRSPRLRSDYTPSLPHAAAHTDPRLARHVTPSSLHVPKVNAMRHEIDEEKAEAAIVGGPPNQPHTAPHNYNTASAHLSSSLLSAQSAACARPMRFIFPRGAVGSIIIVLLSPTSRERYRRMSHERIEKAATSRECALRTLAPFCSPPPPALLQPLPTT
jgi:hypothetical protein